MNFQDFINSDNATAIDVNNCSVSFGFSDDDYPEQTTPTATVAVSISKKQFDSILFMYEHFAMISSEVIDEHVFNVKSFLSCHFKDVYHLTPPSCLEQQGGNL